MQTRAKRPPIDLSENHRRGISSSLHLLDKQLCQWEQWIEHHPAPGGMYQQRDNLSARQKGEVRRRISEMRRVIVQLREDLKLEPARPTTSSLIVGGANVLWEMLCELNSTSLRGYGDVPTELAQYLNPLGETLTQRMYEIAKLFS
jgi:hypothetical protein